MATPVPVVLPGDSTGLPYGTDHDRVEYGYRTPDGECHWGYPLDFASNPNLLSTQAGQDAANAAYQARVRALGLVVDPEEHKLRFLQRAEQLRYTDPAPLVPVVAPPTPPVEEPPVEEPPSEEPPAEEEPPVEETTTEEDPA